MIPSNLREAFFKGDATMMLVLFDNTTSSDDSMDAVGEMRKIANEQCFISGMTGVVADIKNLALKELPIYVVIEQGQKVGGEGRVVEIDGLDGDVGHCGGG